MTHFPFRLLTAAIVFASISLPASATTITGGDFTTWTLTSYSIAGGIVSGSLLPGGGNPEYNISVTTDTRYTAEDAAGITVYNPNSTTHSPLAGSFLLSIDAHAGEGSQGQGQGIFVVVAQGSNVYIKGLNVTYVPSGWQNYIFSGDFDHPEGFLRVAGTGPATPDFSGATASSLGFGAGNSGSAPLTQFYDNFSLTYTAVTPVPEPASFALLGTGLASVAGVARRRSRA